MGRKEERRDDWLMELGLTADVDWPEIEQAYLDAKAVWSPQRFAADPRVMAQAEEQLVVLEGAYRGLLPSRPWTDVRCPGCGGLSRVRVKVGANSSLKVRCPHKECGAVFPLVARNSAGDVEAAAESPNEPVSTENFERVLLDARFRFLEPIEGRLNTFVIISGYGREEQWWADEANEEADLSLRLELVDRGYEPVRVFRISPKGNETPSWALRMPADEARTVGANYRQTGVFLVRGGNLALTLCGSIRSSVVLGSLWDRLDPSGVEE